MEDHGRDQEDQRELSLRTELGLRGIEFASVHGLLHERTDGQIPGIIFGRDADGGHGNFHPRAYQRICNDPAWAKRLRKVHTASKRARLRADWQWKELDCQTSSDALLMNIFCYPGLLDILSVRGMLGTGPNNQPDFGYKPRIPLLGNKLDSTEIDMKLDSLLVEAKLTESNFQSARSSLVQRYRDLEAVFDLGQLSSLDGRYDSYQLIRGTLAAYATGFSYCVFCDSRRPDMIERWFRIMRAVQVFELRNRLKLLTWQELAPVLPLDLQQFLAAKYGIRAAR